jgi:NodT family efflux transporter outer membrane factor (OMF) lipoprotein
LSIARADAKAEKQTFDLVQARYSRGFTNELDPAIAQRELAAVQAELAPLDASIRQSQRRLTVLLGRFPDDLAAEMNQPGVLPQLPDRIEPGLPIELLRRRPDVRQAERTLAAATARIGVAADALYPHVFISGALGVQGQGFGRTPLESSFIGSIGPGAYWPLLDFGTLDALVERQDYRTRELLLDYQRTVLAAVEEVDDAISNYAAQQDRLQNLQTALTAAQNAVQIASERYKRGFTNFLDVLDAQREYYALQDQYAVAQEEVVLQYIALFKALGGGWENYQSVPAIRRPRPAILATFDPTPTN